MSVDPVGKFLLTQIVVIADLETGPISRRSQRWPLRKPLGLLWAGLVGRRGGKTHVWAQKPASNALKASAAGVGPMVLEMKREGHGPKPDRSGAI